jgi:hypothetical protein
VNLEAAVNDLLNIPLTTLQAPTNGLPWDTEGSTIDTLEAILDAPLPGLALATEKVKYLYFSHPGSPTLTESDSEGSDDDLEYIPRSDKGASPSSPQDAIPDMVGSYHCGRGDFC